MTTTMTTVFWCLSDARNRIWFDGNADRLRAWVRHTNEVSGYRPDSLPPLFRSENHGCGYPVPGEFVR